MSASGESDAYAGAYQTLSASGDTTGAADTAAIQAALTGATPTAGTVVLRPGTYYLNAPIVVGPLGTASPSVPQPAPSLIALSSAGHIGDVSLATGDKSAVEITCAAGFPSGKYMIDYQMGTTAGSAGPSGATISGFSLNCASLGAGLRIQGARRFRVRDISINHAHAPSGYANNESGALDIQSPNNGTAGAYSEYDNISIFSAASNGVHHNAPNQDSFYGCNVQLSGGANYFLDAACQATFTNCSSQGGGAQNLFGWDIIGAGATIIGGSTEVPSDATNQNAVRLQGQGNPLSVTNLIRFIGVQFVNGPGSTYGENNASVVYGFFTTGRPQGAKFIGCDFQAHTFTKDWVYVDPSTTGYIDFDNCTFIGTPTNLSYNDASGNNVLRFNKCRGINPVGVVTPAVPASGSAVAAQPYDRTFYVSTVAGTTSCSMAIQGGPTVTFVASVAQVIAVRVPAGQTVTPTYTGTAPTWVVEGE